MGALTLDSALVEQLRDKAIEQLQAALDTARDEPRQRAVLAERLGELLRSAGRLEGAVHAYREAAKLDGQRERAAHLARCLDGELDGISDVALRRLGISPFWIIDDVLEPARLADLLCRIDEGQNDFEPSLVDSGVRYGDASGPRRRSLTKLDAEQWLPELQQGVFELLPQACARLGIEVFEPRRWELQLTAHGDGDYYRCHIDGRDRRISCVFYCFREPRQFRGGDLLLFDPKGSDGYEPSRLTRIVPKSNSLVLFDSRTAHEVMPVQLDSDEFMDRRFAFNGWVSSRG